MKSATVIAHCATWLALAAATAAQTQTAVKLEDLTHPEVRQRDVRVVILPIGSTEPHANHLPYGTDTWTTDAMAARVAARATEKGAKVLVLPTMPYGVNTNQAPNPYAQSIRPATLTQFVKDTVDTAEQHGIRKLVILNGHGGNTTTLQAALRELFASNPKVFVAMVETWVPYRDQLEKVIETGGDHASEEETSIALALFPERIRMEKAVKAREAELKLPSLKTPYINFIRPWKYVSDTTGLGDPTKGTAEKGKRLIEIFLERISTFLKELSDAQLTETFPY
ncbi:MAG: creatininase family protein [Acidobacteria bacterium]|nr:creatininase family protein [Acidobacteriota bacterium]